MPRLLASQRKVLEVDHVAVVGVRGRVVDLFTPDVGEDALGVARVFRNQAVHLGQRRGDALGIGIVKGEAHAENDSCQ